MPNSSPKTEAKPAKEDSLNSVLDDFKRSWEYCQGSWHARWKRSYSLYNLERVKRGYEGISDSFVPMTFSTIETLTSGMFGSKPKFNYLPPQDKADQKTDILNALLDSYWEKDQWSLKVINTGRNMFRLGTAVDYFYWDRDHPVLINVPIRDFFIDPMASSIENARYMGRRYLTTKAELESFEIIDTEKSTEDEPVYKKKYTNLDKLTQYKSPDNTDKEEKDMWYGSTLAEPEDDQVEVIEYWTEDKTISVANRCTVIEDTENYYKAKARENGDKYPCGLMPFADARDYVDESLFYAKGEIDFIGDEQEDLNDLTNQNKDAITYALNQMYTLDPKHADQIQDVENLPGAVYPFEAGTLVPVPRGTIPADAYNERQNIKAEIRETTASNEIIKGVAQEGAKTTATEINAQIAGAGQRINLKVTQLENGYFHRVARIVHAMVKLYVTEPMMVRILGKDGARWEEFDPEEFKGDYEPRVQLDISIENKKQEQAAQAEKLLAAFVNDPDVNQQELKKMVLQRSFDLDPDEVELLMQPLPAPGMGGPEDMMGGEGMPPADPGMIPPMDMGMDMPAPPPEVPLPPEPVVDPVTGMLIDPVTGQPIPMPQDMMA